MINMKKIKCLFIVGFSLLSLCSCKEKQVTCYMSRAVETNGSVESQILFDEDSKTYYVKSLEQGENRHFVDSFSDDIYFYLNHKLVKQEQEGYQELRERALSSSTVYVDFQRYYAPCFVDGSYFNGYESVFLGPVYEDYTRAFARCVYFEKMSDEFYQSQDFDPLYGRFKK